jgi:UDP-N-acetylmuramoylalanine--D-glutamate ligase
MNTAVNTDILVLSPGVPIDHPLAVAFKRAKKSVVGETEIAARLFKGLSVAVTGTNGKTTTVSMIEKVLRDSGFHALACGNIGTPMIGIMNEPADVVAVAEISSFQLETLNSLCPHIAVILNVTEDHLNRHYNMENYIFLKRKLLKNLTEAEWAVLNYDDPIVRAFAEGCKAKIVWFSAKERVDGAYFSGGELFYGGEKILSFDEMLVSGIHNVQNSLAALACAKLFGISGEQIARSLKEFKGIRHRIEKIATVDGVTYVDDSKGTNVDATVKAVNTMKEETVLLLGGKDKGYDYGALFSAIRGGKVVASVLYGENRFSLLSAARKCGFEPVYVCPAFEEAVRLGSLLAKSGQTVLLSPASASFDAFSGYEERGDRFCAIVRSFEASAEEGAEVASLFVDEAE